LLQGIFAADLRRHTPIRKQNLFSREWTRTNANFFGVVWMNSFLLCYAFLTEIRPDALLSSAALWLIFYRQGLGKDLHQFLHARRNFIVQDDDACFRRGLEHGHCQITCHSA
jgi:hypothetical protein